MEPTQEEEGAYHEAGHAALILHFGGEVVTATAMLTSSRCAGMFKAGELMYYESLERVHQHIQIMSAGYFAVALYYKDITDMEAALMTGNRDLRTVSDLQRRFQISGEVMAKLEADAKSLVKQLWPHVEQIASMILDRGSFDSRWASDLKPVDQPKRKRKRVHDQNR